MDLKALLKEIEKPVFQRKMVKAAFSVMSEQETEMEKIQVEIELPTEFLELMKLIADATLTPVETVLSDMARKGVLQQFKESFGQGMLRQKAKEEEAFQLLQQEGVDIAGLGQKLKQLEGLAQQLGQVQKAVENVAAGIKPRNPPESEEDSEKSDVSPRKNTRRKTRKRPSKGNAK